MPPPELVLSLAVLLLIVQSVMVRGPAWLHTPPPPLAAVLPLTMVAEMTDCPWRKIAPPPLPPLAVLPVKVLPVIVVVVLVDCTRTAPPSAVDVLPVKELSVIP